MKILVKYPREKSKIIECENNVQTVEQCFKSIYEEQGGKFEGKFNVLDIDSENELKMAYNGYAELLEHLHNITYYENDKSKYDIFGMIVFMRVEKYSEIEKVVDLTEEDIEQIEKIINICENGGSPE